MANKSIVIRVDGNSKIGLGHIYRGIALAEMLKDEFELSFVTKADTTIIPIKEAGFCYSLLPDGIVYNDEPRWLKQNTNANIIICDGYEFKSEYQKQIKQQGFKLVYVDDLAAFHMYADVVINHSLGVKESDYSAEPYTRFALGLDYALLRQSFINFDKKLKEISNKVETVFVSFGGADPNDFTYRTVKQLLNIHNLKTINIVLGSAYSHKNIFTLESEKIKIYQNIGETQMFDIMSSSDLAVIPASTVSIELAALGVPMIIGYYTYNQQRVYEGLIVEHVAYPLGDFNQLNFDNLQKYVSKLIGNKTKYFRKIEINPKENIKSLFMFNQLTIRLVEKKDIEFVFNLSNEEEVRKNSFNSEFISFEDHKEWFNNQIKNSKKLFYILEYKKFPVGQVRFTKNKDHSVIGISISKEYRGRGYAVEGLKIACNKYFEENYLPIFAYIKKNNRASLKAFEKAGFRYLRDAQVKNISSYLYIRENKNNENS